MATSRPIQPRERGTSPSSSSTPAPGGRRNSLPVGSPDRRLPTTPEKTAAGPRALKPKPTPSTPSTTTPTRSPATQARSPACATRSPSPTAAKRQPVVKKSIEKPPASASCKPQRTSSTPVTTRERSAKSRSRSPSPVPRPSLSRTKTSSLPSSDKGTKKTGAKAAAYTRSKSLNQRRKDQVAAVPSTFIEPTSASDSEVTDFKKADREAEEAEKELFVPSDDSPKTEEAQVECAVVVTSNAEEATTANDTASQSESPAAENEEAQDHEDAAKEEDEPEEVKEETTEAMLVDMSPKEPVVETAHQVKPVAELVQEVKPVAVAKEASPKGNGTAAAAKKDGQRSNDVIEETKSKLMEKRKNKVLALVGAFETVMALQEPEGQESQLHEERRGD